MEQNSVKIVLFANSTNSKTGNIPQTYSSENSCPIRCPFKHSGCYAECGPANWAWKKVVNGVTASELKSVLNKYTTVKILRHNVAGDIAKPGTSDIDTDVLSELNKAYRNHKAYTYTHCTINQKNIEAVKASRMVISFSCETLDQVRECHKNNVPSVMAVHTMSKKTMKIDGITFVQCPATLDGKIKTNCSECGMCANKKRKKVVVFPVHGVAKNKASFLIDL